MSGNMGIIEKSMGVDMRGSAMGIVGVSPD